MANDDISPARRRLRRGAGATLMVSIAHAAGQGKARQGEAPSAAVGEGPASTLRLRDPRRDYTAPPFSEQTQQWLDLRRK
ncbi:hypothetical protein F7R26_038550 (plasmid) [Cupriavidus basilensis]|uniref:Uncharacterized protein n=1 Tax=Cupriavidus basilensis TaxID=68895 RepID=A0A7M2HAA6_9BURK|nr:hypothetical protein F7R26_038550 [Cupriavidus basilensis]